MCETSLPKPIIKYTLLGCPGIRIVDDKRGSFLEFAVSNTFTGPNLYSLCARIFGTLGLPCLVVARGSVDFGRHTQQCLRQLQ